MMTLAIHAGDPDACKQSCENKKNREIADHQILQVLRFASQFPVCSADRIARGLPSIIASKVYGALLTAIKC